MKYRILLFIFLKFTVFAQENEPVLELNCKEAYFAELVELTVIVPLIENQQVDKVSLNVLKGAIDIQNRRNTYSISYETESGIYTDMHKEHFSIVLLDRKEVQLKSRIQFHDGTSVFSKPVSIGIIPHPEIDDDYFIRCKSLTESWVSGTAGEIVIELFSKDKFTGNEAVRIQCEESDIFQLDPLPVRVVYLKGLYHELLTIPVSITFNKPGIYSILPQNISLSFTAFETNKIYYKDVPVYDATVNVSDSTDTRDTETPEIIKASWLTLDAEGIPDVLKSGDELQLKITIKSDGNISGIDSLAPYAKLGEIAMEQKGDPEVLWIDDHIEMHKTFLFTQKVKSWFGMDLGSVKIPYSGENSEIKEASLILGNIRGDFDPAAVIIFFAVIIFTGYIIIMFIFRSIKKQTTAVLPSLKKTKDKKAQLLLISETYGLTGREREILEILIQGKSTKEIADILYISPDTAKKHINNIMRKTNTHSRLEIYVFVDKLMKNQ